MPILTNATKLLQERLCRDRILFLETESQEAQDVLSYVVDDFVQKNNATFTNDFAKGRTFLGKAVRDKNTVFVVHVRDWHRFSGNDVMLHYNEVFEEDMRDYGPDSGLPEYMRTRRALFLDGEFVELDKPPFHNIKLVFSGKSDPMEDPGLCQRVSSYKLRIE